MNGRIVRAEQNSSRISVIGKIKIGEKVKNAAGKEHPKALDYFITFDSKYEEMFRSAYGEKPSKIDIVFISDNLKDVCDESYQFRDGQGRLLAEGNGEHWKAYNAKLDKFEYGVEATLEEMQNTLKGAAFSNILTLRFLMPRIKVFGVWQFTTKGVLSSIPAIRDTFDYVQREAGTVVNIPFDLIVKKVTSQKPGAKSVYSTVDLIPNMTNESMLILSEFVESGQRLRGILTEEKVKQLTNGGSIAQLEAHTEEIETAVVIEETATAAPTAEAKKETAVIDETANKDPNNTKPQPVDTTVYLDENEQGFLRGEMKRANLTPEQIDLILQYQEIESWQKFPASKKDKIYKAVKDGSALKKAKELQGVK